jgi:magnesium-transporting ATPase (P-type)
MLRIVCVLQARGTIIGVTRYCVNDVPAPRLRTEDCGNSRGGGMVVARKSADMVFLEEFPAIVIVLEWAVLDSQSVLLFVDSTLPQPVWCIPV